MKSPFKRFTVYDLETGGLKWKFNSITEFAGVAIDSETLGIIEEFSVMFRPRLDLKYREAEPIKEARAIFKDLATPDIETNIKSIAYKGKSITLKSIDKLSEDLEEFYEYLKERIIDLGEDAGVVFTYEQYIDLLETEHGDIIEVYFNRTYNPVALEVTHMSIDLLLSEGVEYEDAFKQIQEFFERHVVGNSKPILVGHNIKTFDNDFMVRLFDDFKIDFFKCIHKYMVDTLERARERWVELPNFTLGVCANAVGLTLKEAHRALADTVANAKFFIKLLQSARGEGSQESTYKRRKFKFNF